MNTLTKMALGLIGQLRPEAPTGDGSPALLLPPPDRAGGVPLMQGFSKSVRIGHRFERAEVLPGLLKMPDGVFDLHHFRAQSRSEVHVFLQS